jgi:hypothetical protein
MPECNHLGKNEIHISKKLFKNDSAISYMAKSGRWGHRPRRAAAVRVPTSGLHGESKFYF